MRCEHWISSSISGLPAGVCLKRNHCLVKVDLSPSLLTQDGIWLHTSKILCPPAGGYGAGRGRFGGRGEGRGRGRGNFEAVPAERNGPPGEAQRGTAARPGTDVILPGTDEMERTLATSLSTITDSMKVSMAG